MFDDLPKSEFEIVGSDGSSKGVVKGIYSAKQITIFDEQADLAAGYELRRKIPNGSEEAFEVLDPVFQQAFHGIPAHFQVSIRRKGSFSAGTGGNYTVHVNGTNSRVNIHSIDNSTNIVNDNGIFADLKNVISTRVNDSTDREALLKRVDDMQRSTDNKSGFLDAYQKFIANAASHMGVIAPFLPALAKLME